MSAYRRIALELFPEFRKEIEQSINPHELWGTLTIAFENAYKANPKDEHTIKRVCD